jgi:hypothetical protein
VYNEDGTPKTKTEFYTGLRYRNGEYVRVINEPTIRKVWETITVGYVADHCTIDEEYPKDHRMGKLFPCSHYVRYDGIRHWNRPYKEDRTYYHAGHRNNENMALREVTKNFNSGEDIDGWDNPKVENRRKRHNGWWD